jgi:hypothetical protein
MKTSVKVFLVMIAALFAVPVLAAVFTGTWTNATQNTDGSAIPATGPGSITQTTLQYGTCNGADFLGLIGEVQAAGTATSQSLPDLGPGTYCFRAKHTNTFGNSSAYSNVMTKTVAAPVPNPPVLTGIN